MFDKYYVSLKNTDINERVKFYADNFLRVVLYNGRQLT